MQTLRGIWILAVFLTTAMATVPWQTLAIRLKLKSRKMLPHRYSRFLCRLFGLKVTVIGEPLRDRGVLMVSNHTSYLDIIVLGGVSPVSFVAKSEVNDWPFFGLMARLYETVFVERNRRSKAGAARDQLRQRLKAGDALVLFPEGTSNDGNRVLPFKSALMGAVEAEVGSDAQGHVRHVPVQPVSITYVGFQGMPMGRENRPLFAWYGDMELVPHLWEAVTAGPVEVVVEFHQPMSVDTVGDRKTLAARAEAVVRRGQARALAGLSGAHPPTTGRSRALAGAIA
ncbi:MAG TPA: lysophospholipid acyltransferase family protein [Rhizomicrobium sp.]|jgi:1-acyl-sn-glycerol-3-phosphate acyltransferase|nr:lysophospholipid acyltransferase family protein [Rhizomicrobium sp.]